MAITTNALVLMDVANGVSHLIAQRLLAISAHFGMPDMRSRNPIEKARGWWRRLEGRRLLGRQRRRVDRADRALAAWVANQVVDGAFFPRAGLASAWAISCCK
jgi:S-adenosylmethionine synthetase